MAKVVSTEAVAAALVRLGFIELTGRDADSHRIFKHRAAGLTVTVPRNGEPMRPVHLSAIRRQISNFAIASDEEFDRQLSARRRG
jgi:predicted RNA binding protein YcfA (HicA-like mRNA interferase family)